MRVLFIHANREDTVEYDVHALLSDNVDPAALDAFFVWQDRVHNPAKNRPAQASRPQQTFRFDFGRDQSLQPRPTRAQRALMMGLRYPAALAFLAATIRRVKPDIIYTSQQKLDAHLGSLFSRIFHIPHVLHLHYIVGPWLGPATLRTLRKAHHVIAVSEFIRQDAINAGVPPHAVHTLHNPVDPQRFNHPRNTTALRAEFGFPPDAPVIVSAGRLDPSKGHLLLFDAFMRVRTEVPNARLLVCGGTGLEAEHSVRLRRRVEDLGIGGEVVFAGQRNDMPAIFAGSDVFCLPSEQEPFGLVFAEAMVCGLPVVACRSGAVPEIVVDGGTGLLATPSNHEELAAHLCAVLRQPALAKAMGAAGRERALTQFAPASIAAQWAELLSQFSADPLSTKSQPSLRSLG